jgi:hypothetical protein
MDDVLATFILAYFLSFDANFFFGKTYFLIKINLSIRLTFLHFLNSKDLLFEKFGLLFQIL